MPVHHGKLNIETEARPTFHNVTDNARDTVARSGIKNGLLTVYSQHTTCSVIIQEDSYDTTGDGTKFLLQDLVDGLEKLFPKCLRAGQYRHPGPQLLKHCEEELNESLAEALNTDGHLRSCLIGRSESIPIVDGKLELGQFGQIYFVDFDSVRVRKRVVHFQVLGE
jgi:secondary thiamine-phosphate synthase enzyme